MDINFMNKGRKYENGETSNQRSVMARIHHPRQPPTASATLLHCVFTPFGRQSPKNAKKIPKKGLNKTKDDSTMQSAFKRTVQLKKLLQCNEMVQDAFLAPRLGQKVSPKRIWVEY